MKSWSRMHWMTVIHLLLALLEGYCMEVASSSRLPDIYWNVSNPIFRIDNTDHIIDVNRGNNKFEYDQVNLICPSYPEGTKEEDTESYIIYNVSKEEYDSCSITNPNARTVAVCDRPHQLMYFTITFRSFTPQPGGLEFKPGQDYYFITTSTGNPEGVHNKMGGKCASSHMKVTFKVCCGAESSSKTSSRTNDTSSSASNNVTASFSSPVQGNHNSKNNIPVTQTSRILTVLTTPTTKIPGVRSHSNGHHHPRRTTPAPTSFPTYPSIKAPSLPWSNNHHHVVPPSPVFNGRPGWETISTTTSSPIFSVTQSTHPLSTPFWWRPHHNNNNRLLPPGIRSGQEMSGSTSDNNTSDRSNGGGHKKGRAWLLVVAAGIAVGVACLIVCGLGVGRRLFIRDKHKETVIHHHVYPRL